MWQPRKRFIPFRDSHKEQQMQNYIQKAMRTQADQQKILDRLVKLGPKAMQLDNAIRGLCNDAGELAEPIKRYIEYGKDDAIDITNMIEEVGDVLWRLAQICDALDITLEQCMEANIRKLSKRYPEKYSDMQAWEENRNREQERQALERTDGGCTPIAPSPDCDICEGTGQVGGKDASLNSDPCFKCFPQYPCQHRVKEMKRDGFVCLSCKKKFTNVEVGFHHCVTTSIGPDKTLPPISVPDSWDKSPYPSPVKNSNEQTGAGWAEPKEDSDESSESILKRKPLGHSYTRYCSVCKKQPVHKANSIGICTSCYMKHGEPKNDNQ